MRIEKVNDYKYQLKNIMKNIIKNNPDLTAQYDEKADEIFEVYRKYEKIIQRDKGRYSELLNDDNENDHCLVAAAICCSVLKVRPINPIMGDTGKYLEAEDKKANELCAYIIGMAVIYNYWESRHEENPHTIIERPSPIIDDSTYNDWFVRLVNREVFEHFNCDNEEMFEITMVYYIEHIYYLLECYNEAFHYERAN
jgi:hypothetical protein